MNVLPIAVVERDRSVHSPDLGGLPWRLGGGLPRFTGRWWRGRGPVGSLGAMEQREEPVAMAEATDEERAQARAEFRRKLAEAESRMTPEKRDKVRAALGLDTRAA